MTFNKQELEKYSSAVTLSDMEIFVFPELLYSLVLANIMSPIIWSWREDPWFSKVANKNPYRKVMRLKQFIMNNFEFNLDLDTWGLTDSEEEMRRFEPFIDLDIVRSSNALFGYEGDKYYFDLDIRRHFGLDKYTTNAIPYWKTETVEAMSAFHLKEGYQRGAGECVSLSTLYAAALFVVCEVPLKDIFLMATPLHSQNYISVADGILTNNRRIVTKNMLFNGTELTAKSQRAIRNEQVTIVSHHTGHIHVAYPEATIDSAAYDRFQREIAAYLVADRIDYDILINFLRFHSELQSCFQIEHSCHAKLRYVAAEKVFASEHASSYRANSDTSTHLLEEMDEYEFFSDPIDGRIVLNQFEAILKKQHVDPHNPESLHEFANTMNCRNERSIEIADKLLSFCHLEPRLPGTEKTFTKSPPIEITPEMGRMGVIEYLRSMRTESTVADLAFYAHRDMASCDWTPFISAALERNPVCREASSAMSIEELTTHFDEMPAESIYDGSRIAQPDEVWNFNSGDGLEKVICLASILKNREPNTRISINSDKQTACLKFGESQIELPTQKELQVDLSI